jgi:hypothetical protein
MFSQFVLGGIMSGNVKRGRVVTGLVAIALLISGSGAVVQPALAQLETETKVDVPAEQPSPVQVAQVGLAGVEGIGHSEGNRIIRRFLTQADNRVANGAQRLRVLRVQPIAIEKDPITGGLAPQATVLLVVFNYTTGKALRYQVNAQTGKTLSSEVLSGQPAASEEEILAAAEVLYRQLDLARIAQQGILEDGFAVTPPPGQPTTHRYIQLRILNVNRTEVLRTVTVNLTQLTIVPT